MMDELKELLRYAFQTENRVTFPISGPGSVGMETCFVNLIEPGDKVLGAAERAALPRGAGDTARRGVRDAGPPGPRRAAPCAARHVAALRARVLRLRSDPRPRARIALQR
jgi:hypothetical protein